MVKGKHQNGHCGSKLIIEICLKGLIRAIGKELRIKYVNTPI